MNTLKAQALERRVFTSFLRDGSPEAVTAILLLQLGLTIYLSRSGHSDLQSALVALAVGLLLFTGVFAFKRYVVARYLGHVTFLEERRRRQSRLVIVPTVALLVGIAISYTLFREAGAVSILVGLAPLTLTPVLMFSAAAYFLDMGRLYVYGAIFGLVVPLGKYLGTVIVSLHTLPLTVLIAAFIFFGIAAFLSIGFVWKFRPPGGRS